jgi:hypothetical protein
MYSAKESKMKEESKKNFPAEGELDAILQAVSDLNNQARNILKSRQITFEDARQLSYDVAQVRVLLGELGSRTGQSYRGVPVPAAFGLMKDLYWELEGLVKEVRNNLDRERMKTEVEEAGKSWRES